MIIALLIFSFCVLNKEVFDEWHDVAVEDDVWLWRFVACSVVFHHLVWVEDVGANL